MLFEVSIVPLGLGVHLSNSIADILRIIDDSELPYQLTPTATCIEGEWDEVMPLLWTCHQQARQASSHVITTIKIEDDDDVHNKLQRNLDSVEEKAGRDLQTEPVDSKEEKDE